MTLFDDMNDLEIKKKVFIHTFGCQMNKLDSELALSGLLERGFAQAASPAEADVIIFNTCSVRKHAEDRVFSHLGMLKAAKQRRPGLIIGVMGCMAQRMGKEILRRAPHVGFVCGTHEFPRLHEIIAACERDERVEACLPAELHAPERRLQTRPERHRAFIGIMRGCDSYCAYCIVPRLRGRELSRPPAEIIEEARRLAADGCREITLLGQTVNNYGKRFSPAAPPGETIANLAELLPRLGEIPGLARLRFVTSHPRFMTRELFAAMAATPAVCEHLHLPAQAGADRVLAAMRRGYTREQYLDILEMGRALAPGIAYASDFIVGFPGETAAEFEETVELMRRARFHNCFIFKYSPRPDTAAAEMADDIPAAEKSRRNHALLKLQEEISREENARMHGSVVEALVDGPSPHDPAHRHGRTRQNHIVVFDGKAEAGELVKARITSSTPLTLFGELLRAED